MKNFLKEFRDNEMAVAFSVMLLVVLLIMGLCAYIMIAFPTYEEIREYKYELITTKDSSQTEGNINGNAFHISGRVETEEVYRLYYWVDKTIKEADTKTLYANETRLFFDLQEGETPYFVEAQTIKYSVYGKTGVRKKEEVKSTAYELHLPANAIIQDFEIDAEN